MPTPEAQQTPLESCTAFLPVLLDQTEDERECRFPDPDYLQSLREKVDELRADIARLQPT